MTVHQCAVCGELIDDQSEADAVSVPGLGEWWFCDACARAALSLVLRDLASITTADAAHILVSVGDKPVARRALQAAGIAV